MSSVLLGSSTPEQLIENLGAIQASIAALPSKPQACYSVSPGSVLDSVWGTGSCKQQQRAYNTWALGLSSAYLTNTFLGFHSGSFFVGQCIPMSNPVNDLLVLAMEACLTVHLSM